MKKIILSFTLLLFICFSAAAQQKDGTTRNWNTSFSKTEQNQPEVKIYPNPCKDNKVTIELNNQELSEIKIKIEGAIKSLPPQKLKIALDFLEDLKVSDEDETLALLNDNSFMEDYREAKEDIKTGNTIGWKDIKRDV